jgi:hypothetical protein
VFCGTALGELGRREEAAATMEEAVRIYRRLALAFPDDIDPALAVGLINLSVI